MVRARGFRGARALGGTFRGGLGCFGGDCLGQQA